MSKSKKTLIITVCIITGIILAVSAVFGIYLYAFAQSEKYYGEMLSASMFDSSCKIYLYDMIKGDTSSRDRSSGKTPEPLFPEWGDDEDTRREKAYEKTVGEALEYYGYYDRYKNADNLYKYGVTYKHDIVLMKDRYGKVFEYINKDISLTENTTLGEIFK